MCRQSDRRFGTSLASMGLLVALGGLPGVAEAQYQLGPIDNALLQNPYASPADGQFGRGVVSGDFDDDGISDLAISEFNSARLRILRGVAFTVGSDPTIKFIGSTVTMPVHDYEMVSGDFDGDGRDEIAVGSAGMNYSGMNAAGGVYVMNLAGGTWAVQSEIHPGGAYPGAPQASANFGFSLAAGDYDDDGYTDLAIGIPGQTVAGTTRAGAVMITYGGQFGIVGSQARIINRGNDGLTFTPSQNDYFGWDVAAGDFDGDADDDLAIGIKNATCPNGTDRAGAVLVLNGSEADGITNADSHIWRPGVQGIAGNCTTGDSFGQALASGHFSTIGFGSFIGDDLVIGAPGSNGDAGAVNVIRGSSAGLTANGNKRLLPPTLAGIVSGNGQFGTVVAAGSLSFTCVSNCTGDSLVVGAPFSTINGTSNAGAAWVFFNTVEAGINAANVRPVLPLPPLKIAGPHDNDRFGSQLAIGDFNDHEGVDLAIGAYNYDDGGEEDAGAVQVLYQSDLLFVDGFE